jgi:hypothetical protein
VDWSKLPEGLSNANITFTAVSGTPPTTMTFPAFILANKTSVPTGFKGINSPQATFREFRF